jgi:hypothetical protein
MELSRGACHHGSLTLLAFLSQVNHPRFIISRSGVEWLPGQVHIEKESEYRHPDRMQVHQVAGYKRSQNLVASRSRCVMIILDRLFVCQLESNS